MSWRITIAGDSKLGPEAETETVNGLTAALYAQAVAAGLNPTDGMTSTPGKNLTFAKLRQRARKEASSI